MRSPLNTVADPLMNLLGALDAQMRTGDPTSAILEQEASGQRQLVASEVLPFKINSPYGTEAQKLAKEKLEVAGFKFGQVVPRDPLFQEVELPAGWKKVGTGHMWSSVVDDKGRERISVFYKAAFYDRVAFMNINEGNWD